MSNTPTVVSTSTTTFDSNGRTTQTTDSFGKISQTQYDNKGNVVESRSQTIDQFGAAMWMVTRTVYDSRGRAILSTDPYTVPASTALGSGNSTAVFASKTEFDARGRASRSVRLTGVVVGIDATTKQTNILTSGTEVSSSSTEYDEKGRAYRQTGADGQISTTEYDIRGRAVATLGMHVLATSVGLTPIGASNYVRMRSETKYNSLGQAYQSISNIIEYGTVTNGIFTKTSTNDLQKRVTEQVYDAKGQVVKTILPDGTFTQSEYDIFGRVNAEIDQLNNRKDLTYDASGRLIKVELPSVTIPLTATLARPTYLYEYNSQGQMTKLTDANTNVTNFGFNTLFQSTSRTLPSTASETYQYDARGRQTLQVTFEGIRKRTVYDDSATGGGRVLRTELFANKANYDSYMTDANLDGLPDRTLATGTKWELVTMAYDAFGRLVSTNHIYADGATAGDPIPGQFSSDQWTTSYDIQGRVTQETSPTGVIGYEYDSLGRKTRTWAGGVGSTATTALSDITYTYDALGRLSTVNTVKRDGAVVDSNGATAGTPPESTIYHYDLLGRMDYTEMPNSVVEDYTFDNMDRLDVMRHYQSDANNADLTDNLLKDMFDYSYRADGKRTGLVETFKDSGIGVPPVNNNYLTNNYTWSYDNAGRLTSEVLDSSDNSLDQTESYIMDLVGNRIRRTIDKPGTVNDVTDIYTFNSSDQLQSENRFSGLVPTGTPTGSSLQSTAYTWSGTQQTSKAVSVPSTSTVTQSMTYGLSGQLEGVITETKNGSNAVTARTQVEYRYDNSGLRFIAIDSTDSNLTTPGIERTENGRTEYLLDHANMTGYGQTIIETVKNASGQATKRTSYTIGTDEITQTVSTIDPATGNVTASETLTFGHDGHGSTRVLFGAAAAIVQVFTYSAYGELLAIHNAAAQQQALNSAKTTVLYNGESIDSRTGLYNFRARWYAANTGRFADRLDPFAGNPNDPFSLHKYNFTTSRDPIQFADPTGMSELGSLLGGLGLAIGLSGLTFGVMLSADNSMKGYQSGQYDLAQAIYFFGRNSLFAGGASFAAYLSLAQFAKLSAVSMAELLGFELGAGGVLLTEGGDVKTVLNGVVLLMTGDSKSIVLKNVENIKRAARAEGVPAELVAAIMFAEMQDYDYKDFFGDDLATFDKMVGGTPDEHSIGIAQLSIRNVRAWNLTLPEWNATSADATPPQIRRSLWNHEHSSRLLAKAVKFFASQGYASNPGPVDLSNWDSFSLQEKIRLTDVFAGAKDDLSGHLVNEGGLRTGADKGLRWIIESGVLR